MLGLFRGAIITRPDSETTSGTRRTILRQTSKDKQNPFQQPTRAAHPSPFRGPSMRLTWLSGTLKISPPRASVAAMLVSARNCPRRRLDPHLKGRGPRQSTPGICTLRGRPGTTPYVGVWGCSSPQDVDDERPWPARSPIKRNGPQKRVLRTPFLDDPLVSPLQFHPSALVKRKLHRR